eukprot:5048546-Prymnesium_polylepis.2
MTAAAVRRVAAARTAAALRAALLDAPSSRVFSTWPWPVVWRCDKVDKSREGPTGPRRARRYAEGRGGGMGAAGAAAAPRLHAAPRAESAWVSAGVRGRSPGSAGSAVVRGGQRGSAGVRLSPLESGPPESAGDPPEAAGGRRGSHVNGDRKTNVTHIQACTK